MPLSHIIRESGQLAERIHAVLGRPPFDDTDRIRVSHVACSMSIEHWDATRSLLAEGFLASALVVHRAQYEALVRSVWVLYAASENQLGKLATTLTPESEQAAKNLLQIADMITALSSKAPSVAYDALSQFKDISWKALNSYAHAGIHPLRRHEEGYPVPLIDSVLRNTNGLAMISGMQAAALTGSQALMQEVHTLHFEHASCLPPPK